MKYIMYATGIAMIVSASSAHATLIGASNGDLWDLNVTDNTSTLIGNSGVMFDIALNPLSNILYGVSSTGSLFSINQTNASTALVGSTGASINGLTFGADGTLYGSGGNGLYSINLSNGSASIIGTGGYISSGDIAFDNMGNLYLSSTTGVGDSLWTLDTNTGAGTLLNQTGFSNVYGLNYSNNILYGFTLAGQTITLNTSTGVGTFLANNTILANGADGVGGVIDAPEPSSLTLIGLALAGLGFSRRKTKV